MTQVVRPDSEVPVPSGIERRLANVERMLGAITASFTPALPGGGRVSDGSGVPTRPGDVDPMAGDYFLRTDTPTVSNQRLYVCTAGGDAPTWVGIT